jgi:hypothetical protein
VSELLRIATVQNNACVVPPARLGRIILSATKMFARFLMKFRDPYQKLLNKQVVRSCAQ